jgi:hypothetical protein
LFLSPDHAVFVDDVLIPVRHLINGISIARVPTEAITYYHLELPRHDVVLAEGMPAESYLDAGDRANFANSREPMRLFADFEARPIDFATMWETEGCAPLVIHGPKLQSVRDQVTRSADRASREVAAGLADREAVRRIRP